MKSVDKSSLTLSTGQSSLVNYTVTASAQANSSFGVAGQILLINSSAEPITIASLSDSLAPVTCGFSFPITLAKGQQVACTYSGTLGSAAPQNEAIAVDANGTSYTAVAPIDWTKATLTETDECVNVSDTFAGNLGTVCANGQTTFTFTYSRQIGPFAVCGDYTVDNTASFITNDSGSTGSSSATVNVKVPCAGGCSLTPGYWKTHSAFGPAPYDDTWVQIGENSPFFLSGQSYYNVLWTSPNGNAYYILAHAYIAAQLNFLNGADQSAALTAFTQATGLFNTYTPAQISVLKGSSALRQQFISLAGILDSYNNGLIGPGHCSE